MRGISTVVPVSDCRFRSAVRVLAYVDDAVRRSCCCSPRRLSFPVGTRERAELVELTKSTLFVVHENFIGMLRWSVNEVIKRKQSKTILNVVRPKASQAASY